MDHVHLEGYGSGLHLLCDVSSIRVMTLATHLMTNSFTCGLTNAGESSYRETLQIWACNTLWTRHPAYSLWLKFYVAPSSDCWTSSTEKTEDVALLLWVWNVMKLSRIAVSVPAHIIFSTPDFVVPGIWTNLYAFNCFFFFNFFIFILPPCLVLLYSLLAYILPCQFHHSSVLVSCPRLLTCTSSYIQ